MAIRKTWNIEQKQITNEILEACGNNVILATLLANRNINTQDKIKAFLNPLKAPLSLPDVFCDIKKSVDRIQKAIENNENILIYGDFDADGITATAILYLTLKEIGANVDYYIPDRETESHGLNTKALINAISKKKAKLIITVDCGISNITEVNFANSFKTDVIITDHHEAPETLPNAYAILNPKAQNSLIDNLSINELESLNYLAGTGVAFKLACKLLDTYNKQEFVTQIIPICAIGTIGDVVELIGENRRIVQMGIEILKNGQNENIQKLLKAAKIENTSNLTAENIAFGIVPRINAAGRLEKGELALKLFISTNTDEVNEIIEKLNNLNEERQELCDTTFKEATEQFQRESNKKSIILFNKDWHIGIIGIVSSKLVEEYNKPTFLMTQDPNNENIIRCSCRSIQDVNIYEILSEHKDCFAGFGGHKMAAGFSFDKTKYSFEQIKEKINQTIDEQTQNVDFNTIKINADMELSPADISLELTETIKRLEPFGSANPSPLFVMNKLTLTNHKMMGQNENHLKMYLTKENSPIFEAIKWNTPKFNLPQNAELDILFSVRENVFNDKKSVQIITSDIHSEYLKEEKSKTIKLLDHRNKKNIIPQVMEYIETTKKNTLIYIKNTTLIKKLNIPESITEKIFSETDSIDNTEQIMFFEPPCKSEDLSKIIKQTNAQVIHFMNFNPVELSINDFLIKLSGMLKYSLNNLNGELDINRISRALNIDFDTMECAISLLQDVEMIDTEEKTENILVLKKINTIELSKIKENELYTELEINLKKINDFKNKYSNCTIKEIEELIEI